MPSDFVPVTVTEANTTEMAQGWTFVMAGSLQGYVYAIDATGSVRWMFSEPGLGAASVFLPLKNGNYLIGGDKSFGQYYKYNLFELDLTGRIINEYLIDGYHHDACELPSGNLLLYANNVNGKVVEDTLYELDRSTSAILHTWDLNSYFNVGNYNEAGEHISDVNYGADTHDWLHTNGMAYDAATNSILISARHQDAVFSMNLDTGKINWILSDPNDLWPEYLKERLLSPVGDGFEWQYGQHNISLLPNGDIMLFDNGDYRSKTTEGVLDAATQSYSRAVIYRINQQNMTVEQIWQFGKELGTTPYSAYVSSVQYLGENHYLIDFGGIVKNANGDATYNIMDGVQGSSQSQIYEIKNEKIIFHAETYRNGLHGNTYRAVRLMPDSSSQELDLSAGGNRLGSLYCYGLAQEEHFDASNALFNGPEIDIVDNGVQLRISSNSASLDSSTTLALILDGASSDYRVSIPSGANISYTLNHSEIPAGKYYLYLQNGDIVYNLGQEWYNTTDARPFPTGYEVTVNSNLTDSVTVYGNGTYYAGTPFTVSVDCGNDAEFIGWYCDTVLLSSEKTFSLTATNNMTLTATFKSDDVPGGGGATGGGATEVPEEPDTPINVESAFTDVAETDWFADAVNYVSENGLMNGTGDRQFSPNAPASRAMIVTILYRMEGEPAVGEPNFTDVASGQWYSNAIAWAAASGIVTGHTAELFAPNDDITREQLAAILYRYAVYKGYNVTIIGDLSLFSDADLVSDWAITAMQWATEEGLINGVTVDTLVPGGNASRAQVAAILMRFCTNIVG